MSKPKKNKCRYIVEINDWGCGTLIKDTLTGREIDAPAEETVNLCLVEMNRLASEADINRKIIDSKQSVIDNLNLEIERLKDGKDRLERMTMQAEWVVESYDKYLVAQTKGRLDDIKEKSIKFSRCLSGLDLLARREKIAE